MGNTDVTGTLDTTNTQGGENTHAEDDPAQYLDGTLSTLEPGSPTHHADPAYRAPSNPPGGSTVDTTRTDQRTTDGVEHLETPGNMSGTIDTINYVATLQTTTDNTPATPGGAPTVAVVGNQVRVTITPLAEPVGAPLRGYRVEAARVLESGDVPGANTAPGLDFIGADETSILIGTLTPGDRYKFRYAGVNDNGTGAFSPWSSAVIPKITEHPHFSHSTYADHAEPESIADPAGLDPANVVNPVYRPDGTVMSGTGPAVGSISAEWEADEGDDWNLIVTWTASPLTNDDDVDDYDVEVFDGASSLASDTGVAALTTTFTGIATEADPADLPTTLTIVVVANGPDITQSVDVTPSFPAGNAATGFAVAFSAGSDGTHWDATVSWTAPTTGPTPDSYDVKVLNGVTAIVDDNDVASPLAVDDAIVAANVGALPTSLSVTVSANPSGATRTATVTPTHP